MPNGYGRGRGFGAGAGLGLRGSSPPWPYVGLGRGGLPRCSHFFRRGVAPAYQPLPRTGAAGYARFSAATSKEEQLSYLKDQAQAIQEQLDSIQSRMRDLEVKE